MATHLPGIYPGGTGVRMDHPGEDTYLSPWHQEYPYNLTSDNAVTLWLPLVDVDETNGCLRLAPGTQRLGALPVRVRDALNTRRNANETLEIDGLEAILARHRDVGVPARAGDALVFHTFLLHRSQPNRSSASRWTLQARYFDFLNATAVRHDWVGGMNEGVDFRRYHPELVAGPADG
jgi:ectoine hydroxylase-related dioxygenase (phytanoyl-CoA dioxygenase family)